MRRYQDDGRLTAELECGHLMHCTRYPVAKALRCPDCLPVRTYTPPPTAPEETAR